VAATEALDQVAFLAGMGLAVPTVALVGPHHAYGLAGLLGIASIAAIRAVATTASPTPGSLAW
jgi:hypothetical protein